MSLPGWQNLRRFAGLGIALIAVWPTVSHAARSLPQFDTELCDGPEEPDVALPALANLEAEMPRLRDDFETAFNAQVLDNILKSTGDATRVATTATKPSSVRSQNDFIIKSPETSPSKPALASATFGEREGVAVSINPRLAASGKLNTDIRFSHSSAMLDAGFNLATQQSLLSADPMAMRYDGRALVRFGPTMQVGVAAAGTLGTLAMPTLAGNETAGPLVHINLVDRNLSLASDLGYDFGLNPLSAASHTQFHAKLDLKLKL